MKIHFETKGSFDNLEKWLKKVSTNSPNNALKEIANQGVKSLAANTPRDTGATAAGWTADIVTARGVSEIHWTNNAHPGTSVNIATIIDKGHGTRTGGYVPPRPYIKKSMESVWSTAGDKIVKELTK